MCGATAALGQQKAKTSNVMAFQHDITHLPGFLSSQIHMGYMHKKSPLLQLHGWEGKALPDLFYVSQKGCVAQIQSQEDVPSDLHQAAMLEETQKPQSLMNPDLGEAHSNPRLPSS